MPEYYILRKHASGGAEVYHALKSEDPETVVKEAGAYLREYAPATGSPDDEFVIAMVASKPVTASAVFLMSVL